MKFITQPIRLQDAGEIATWQYEPPYAMYSLSPLAIPALLDPINRYQGIRDESGRLLGYCCFGREAMVPGGAYGESEPDVVDVGLGMHPGLVGKGLGKAFVAAILAFAAEAFKPERFRVTIAAFNERSQRAFLGLGFAKTNSFNRVGDGLGFVQLEREASSLHLIGGQK